MTIHPEDLRAVPLFRDISADHLGILLGAFERQQLPAGQVLFRPGDVPTQFLLLLEGEVTLAEEGDDRFRLQPVAPIGELGALTGLPRNSQAVTATACEVASAPVAGLQQLFERQGDLGFRFYRNLMAVVADKVRRDRRRMGEMRDNLIRTQKSMKELRELVLASRETELSRPVYEALEALIEHNRRSHYRVMPVPALPCHTRLDDGRTARVVELSDGYLKLDLPAAAWPKDTDWAAVLVLPGREILVSGRVLRAGADGVVMKLDLLIDEYKAALTDYITRLQLLDFVV